MRLPVRAPVEIAEHRRVAGHTLEQIAEAAQPVLAEDLILLRHPLRVADLSNPRREVAVPEEGHLLHQGAPGVHHPVDPPGPHVVDGVEVEDAADQAVHLGQAVVTLEFEQLVDRSLESDGQAAIQLARRDSESGAAEQVRHSLSRIHRRHRGSSDGGSR